MAYISNGTNDARESPGCVCIFQRMLPNIEITIKVYYNSLHVHIIYMKIWGLDGNR